MLAALLGAAAAVDAGTARGEPPHAAPFTLLDPSLSLPPLTVIAPDLGLRADDLGDEPAETGGPSPVDWELGYRHVELFGTQPTRSLRADSSAGYSRQLDRDVLSLGMSWAMAGNRVGVGYQLQAARDGEIGLSRFLPGSEAATHAFTLGVSREFGAGSPPPAPLPPFALDRALDAPAAEATPSPAP